MLQKLRHTQHICRSGAHGAADAQVLGVPLQFSGSLPGLEDKTWITAKGKVAFELIEGQYFAYLTDCDVKATKPPDPRDQKRR